MAGADAIIHTASLHAPHVGTEHEATFSEVNVVSLRMLIELAKDNGAYFGPS